MLTISGYRLTAQLYESANSLVYRGYRMSSGQPVVLKMLKDTYPTYERMAWFKREYEVTHNLTIPGVVEAYALFRDQERLVMVLEDFGGDSLALLGLAGQLKLSEFLELAISVTEILGEIHASNIIHKDLNPSNIVFNRTTCQVKIIDFGISTVLSREKPTWSNPNVLEGTLAYISPEQTGRMNRGIDYRSDFYSLGVTFYELLTGQLPFQSSDALELVHSHIAKQPIPPHLVKTLRATSLQLPPIVSDIVMKLMAKNAEDRYQSAYGLKADLELCLHQVMSNRQIDFFPLGSGDISDRFQIPQKLYGRSREIETLRAAFQRVSNGTSEMMLVTGYSGVGKSALVNEVSKPMTAKRGSFISGKFDQYQRNIPYEAISQAFNELCNQLLTESTAILNEWQQKILAAVGNNGQVLIDVIPNLELVIGQQPPVAQVEPQEARNRFNWVFQEFIKAISLPCHPLVLFIDDLQWADSASLTLLKTIMSDKDIQYLLLVGAYRDNEVNDTHPLMMTLNDIKKELGIFSTIHLDNLTNSDVNALISEALACPPTDSQALTDLVYTKTQGNAFFTIEFLRSLYAEGLLSFEPKARRWQWDVAEIQAKDITDNVVELMARKIGKLRASTQTILQLAACIGNTFGLSILAIIHQRQSGDIFADLLSAIFQGLVVPLNEQYKLLAAGDNPQPSEVKFKFQHDRVQQAAYALIAEGQKTAVHLQIGRLLWENSSPEELSNKIFEIVDHLNLGFELITAQKERDEIARLNLMAGQKAKAATAYQAALKYLKTGIRLLAEDSWLHTYDLTLALYSCAAQAANLSGEFEQMTRLADTVLQQARTVLDKVKVYEIKIQAYAAQNKLLESVNTDLTVRKLLGINFPESPQPSAITQELEEINANLSGKELRGLEKEMATYNETLCQLKIVPQFHFYDSLSRLAVYPDAHKSEQDDILEQVAANQKKMQIWAHHTPMNFLHKFYLVEAERHRVLGENVEAMENYDKAIAGAKEHEYLNEEALAYELAAKFYLEWGKEIIARTYITEAHYAYTHWGATVKVKDLEERYPQFFTKRSPSPSQTTTTTSTPNTKTSTELDLTSVIKASQTLSGEIVLDTLLGKMMKIVIENAGAQTGYLLMEKDGQWMIQASGTIESDEIQVLQSIPIETVSASSDTPIIANAIVNYVIRTRKSVVLNDATHEGNFTRTPYIVQQQPKSVLCAPLLNQSKLVGIVYLENNLTTGAFTVDRLEVLNLLSSQAAISIENAKLYAELRQSTRKFQGIFNQTFQFTGMLSVDGILLEANQTALDFGGLQRADVVGKPFWECYWWTTSPLTQIQLQSAISQAAQGDFIRYEVDMLGAGDRMATVDFSVKPIFDESGNVEFLIVESRDITIQKQAQRILADYNHTLEAQVAERTEALHKSEKRYRELFEASVDGIANVDIEGRYIDCNASYQRMLGYSLEELQQKSFLEITPVRWHAWEAEIHLKQVINRGYSDTYEKEYIRKDGTIFPVELTAYCLFNDSGQPESKWAIVRDISDRKRAEKERSQLIASLKKSEATLEAAQRIAHIGSWEFDVLTQKLTWSQENFRIFGLDPTGGEPTYAELIELIHPDERMLFQETLSGAIASGMPYKLDFRIVRPNTVSAALANLSASEQASAVATIGASGQVRHIEFRGEAVFNEQGQVIQLFGTTLDITFRKQVEAALTQSERKYRNLVETSQDIIWSVDTQGRFTFINQAVKQIYGYEPSEMLGRPFTDFLPPEQIAPDLELFSDLLQSASVFQYETIHLAKDHRPIHLLFNAIAVLDEQGNVVGTTGTASDITTRKLAEAEILRSRSLLESIFNESPDAIFLVNPETGLIADCNRRAVELFEDSSKDKLLNIEGHTLQREAFTPEQVSSIFDEVALKGVWSQELEYVTKKGKLFWGNIAAKPIHVAGQKMNLVRITDITERKIAEEALRTSEAQNRALLNAIPDLMIRMTKDGTYLDFRPAKSFKTVVSGSDFIGKNIYEIMPPEVSQQRLDYAEQALSTGSTQIYEFQLLADGNTYDQEARIVVCGEDEVLVIVRDITDRKQAEEALRQSEAREREKAQELELALSQLKRTQAQLIQAEKMSSLGRMVAGVAHEINNPVSFIQGNLTPAKSYFQNLLSLLEIYQQTYPHPTPEIEALASEIELEFLVEDWSKLMASMQVGTQRICQIVLSLRSFSRLDESDLKPVDIHEGIDNTLLILQHRLRPVGNYPEIEVIKEYGQLPKVTCYASQLNQVFMNLLSNAIDTLETQCSPRLITIRTSVGTGDWRQGELGTGEESSSTPYSLLPTPSIVIQITDNGFGMSEDVQKKIFDPFFTTKPVGSGTGLGLSISYQIVVEKHKGKLRCISAPGQGTEFIVEIPVNCRAHGNH